MLPCPATPMIATCPLTDRQVAAVPMLALPPGVEPKLVNWTVPVGFSPAGPLRTSTLTRRLNAGDYDSVPGELLRWNKAGNPPRPLPGLTRRRRAEGELFAHGRYD